MQSASTFFDKKKEFSIVSNDYIIMNSVSIKYTTENTEEKNNNAQVNLLFLLIVSKKLISFFKNQLFWKLFEHKQKHRKKKEN